MDSAGMDWLAVTDHQSGQPNASLSDYPVWRIQKAADMFHVPGFFTAVVRDNEVIYSREPAGETYDLRFRESNLPAGEHFYYVRMEQKDGNMAWSSPVWVERK